MKDNIFYRSLNGKFEHINHHDSSAIRIWKNKEYENYSTHWHSAIEIIMPIENDYTVTIHKKEYLLHPGDILIIPPGILHELTAPETGQRLIILFDSSGIAKLKGYATVAAVLTIPILINRDETTEFYRKEYSLLLQIYEESCSNNPLQELIIYSHIINFFIELGRNHIEQGIFSCCIRPNKRQEYLENFEKVFDYIDHHYAENLTLDIVAESAAFSKYHFARLFKEYANMTFYEYLSYKRIRVAEELLANPDLKITEIAMQSGFNSIATFNRIFRKVKNCTPTSYRRLFFHLSDNS